MSISEIHPAYGYVKLWQSVIVDAARCAKGKAPVLTKADHYAARAWIASNDESPRSFLWACSMTGANPEQIRLEIS